MKQQIKPEVKRLIFYSDRSTIFYIDREDQWCFNKGINKGKRVKDLYKEYRWQLIEYLEDLYSRSSIKDKMVIRTIVNEIGIDKKLKINLVVRK